MKEIKLHGKNGKDKFALVDDDDFEELNKTKWYLQKGKYALGNVTLKNKSVTILMHRKVSKASKGDYVDHIDGNGLNNQKHNLRICTNSQNMMNRGRQKNNTSGFKGVCVIKTKYKKGSAVYITAKISVLGKDIFLGNFKSVKLASQAYNEAALKYHGEFAQFNNIQ